MPTPDPNPLDCLFKFIEEAVRRYTLAQEGKLIIECKRRNDDGVSGFQVLLVGYPCTPFPFITAHQLDHFLARQAALSELVGEPFLFLKRAVIDVLNTTGYGTVTLEIHRQKRGKAVSTCSVTFSYRHILSSEA